MLDRTRAGFPYRLEYRAGLIRNIVGRTGWFIISGQRSEGPFVTRELADEIAFYDRNYG